MSLTIYSSEEAVSTGDGSTYVREDDDYRPRNRGCLHLSEDDQSWCYDGKRGTIGKGNGKDENGC